MSGASVAVLQPHYVPWIGYFEMVDRVDEFWLFDDVDFVKRDWKSRNRIRKGRTGSEAKWLSVPVERASQRATPMCEARIAYEHDWRGAHIDAARDAYAAAPYGGQAVELLEEWLSEPADTVAELNARGIEATCAWLGIGTPLRRTSELGVGGRKTERLVAVCRAAGAGSYLANNGSSGYLEPARFEEAGIAWAYQDYAHPEYAQWSGGARLPFLSHLSVLDLVANHGPESLAVIREGRP